MAVLPNINTQTTPSVIARFIPPFLVSHQVFQTPLWKWAALVILALLLISVSRLLDWLLAFLRIGIEIIDPSAIARLYIGRGMDIVLVWSISWCLIRLTELFMNHLELIRRFQSGDFLLCADVGHQRIL